MFSYYSIITLITIAALAVLCVLVHDNTRLPASRRRVFYLTYLLIGLAAAAEWSGLYINGHDTVPHALLLAVKCTDYILTPMAGGALVKQLGLKNRGISALNIILIGNTVFQIISAFFGWMTVINADNSYSHGSLYFVYIILYLMVIAIVFAEFLIYARTSPSRTATPSMP